MILSLWTRTKKESDVGMLQTKHRSKLHVEMVLTGIQSTETSCMQGMLLTGLQNTNKLHVGCHHENQCDETIHQ